MSAEEGLVRLIYQKASLLRIFVVITTSDPQIANTLCGFNGKQRIGPYHLGTYGWDINGDDTKANIDWNGTDAWSLEEITDLIESTFPRMNISLDYLQKESATVGFYEYDLRMPNDAVKYTRFLLAPKESWDDDDADSGLYRRVE